MKKIIISSLIAFISLLNVAAQCNKNGTNPANKADFLLGIQNRIDSVCKIAIKDRNPQLLSDFENPLEKINMNNYLPKYWLAYMYFDLGLVYQSMQDRDKEENAVNKSIALLDNIEKKDSEILALLAYVQSYSIKFFNGMQAGLIAQKSRQNAEKAKQIDENNIRAWYVLGTLDFYTPKAFGGQINCEKYLKKAIEIKEKNEMNPYLPVWGKEDSYIMLINFYMVAKKTDEAVKYIEKAKRLYPDNNTLLQIENEMHK